MNSSGMIGLDDGMRLSERPASDARSKRTKPPEVGEMVVSRSGGFRSAYRRRSDRRKVSVLLVCAAAIVIVGAICVASLGNEVTKQRPSRTSAPPQPYFIYGTTMDALGAPVPFCHINVTNLNTSDYDNTVMSDADGLYGFGVDSFVHGYEVNNTLRVVANTTTLYGQNTSVILTLNPPYMAINVTLTPTAIPEFPSVVIPVAGIGLGLVVMSVVSSRRKEE